MIATGRKTNGMDMTEGPIGLLLIRYAVPLLLGNLFQQMYNTIDSLVVGNFVGTGALAAGSADGFPVRPGGRGPAVRNHVFADQSDLYAILLL